MPSASHARRRLLAVVPLAIVATLGLTALGGTATAQPADPAAATAVSGPVTHPESDRMGSTIRANEPSAAVPRGVAAPAATPALVTNQPLGMDVSNYQGNVDWNRAVGNGAKFAYIKATEGTGFIDRFFNDSYSRSYNAGVIRGAYHFALPDRSSGAAQANYFVNNGGGWSADGMTLPPMLDIEYNPYGPTCYGMSGAQMSAWIRDFSATVLARTGRYPMIYSTAGWWNQCTGYNASFGATNPLMLACYCASPGTMPAGWGYHTIWQFDDKGIFPGDQDVFNGSLDQLRKLASSRDAGTTNPSTPPPARAGTVGPVPDVAEAGGVAGAALNGWAPNTTVTVSMDGIRTSVVTDANGSALAVFNLPPDAAPGTHGISATSGGLTASGIITVTPMAPFSLYQILSAVLRLLLGL